jgi:hypothetical protein
MVCREGVKSCPNCDGKIKRDFSPVRNEKVRNTN